MNGLEFIGQVLSWIWEIGTWVLQTEERLALLMNSLTIPIGQQIIILCAVNSLLLIPTEYGTVHGVWLRSKKVRSIGTPRWLRWLARDKPITLWDLTIFGFIPAGTQKVGVIAWHAKRKEFGWRGYFYLAVGGCARVSLYPLLGKWLWALVVTVLVLRIIDLWYNHNGRKKNSDT